MRPTVIYRVSQKKTNRTHGHSSVKSQPIFEVISSKFAINWLLRYIPPHLVYMYVATPPCETLGPNARKQAINNKLQGSVATYLRCGGDVNNQGLSL